MEMLHKKPYSPPMTDEYHPVTTGFCIGFGECSIPPEESDCNESWYDSDLTGDLDLPESSIRLWDD